MCFLSHRNIYSLSMNKFFREQSEKKNSSVQRKYRKKQRASAVDFAGKNPMSQLMH